jgi:hypothetical protein
LRQDRGNALVNERLAVTLEGELQEASLIHSAMDKDRVSVGLTGADDLVVDNIDRVEV